MKKLIIAACIALFAANAYAADDCAVKAAEKKLAGAAKSSFIKKCEKDAAATNTSSCEARAVGKNGKRLAGAAKAAFIKKCEKDAAAK
ncbi:MAG: hypothetical protein GC139_01445 [Sideroxydans sp.]|nr:hypothetical protein [Sideroxydans sp.]